MTCESCEFWTGNDNEEDSGECRALPPDVVHGWRSTAGTDWCGSYHPIAAGKTTASLPADGWIVAMFDNKQCVGEPIDLIRVIGFEVRSHALHGMQRYEPVIPYSWNHDGQVHQTIGPVSDVLEENAKCRGWVLLEDDPAPDIDLDSLPG